MLDMGVAMDLQWSGSGVVARFDAHVCEFAGHLGHKDREEPLRHWYAGLPLPGGSNSVEPTDFAVSAGIAPGTASRTPTHSQSRTRVTPTSPAPVAHSRTPIVYITSARLGTVTHVSGCTVHPLTSPVPGGERDAKGCAGASRRLPEAG